MDLKKFRSFEVSGLGLGCMGMTGFNGPANKNQCVQAIQTALENGITLLDTADNYGFGENETLIGTAIAPLCKNCLYRNQSWRCTSKRKARVVFHQWDSAIYQAAVCQ